MFSSANIFVISDMASEREAKQLEAATEALGGRVADVKSSLGQLIRKMETDPTLNWHSFLDSYALISGQMNSLLKQMRHEKTPLLRKYITLPLLLSPDRYKIKDEQKQRNRKTETLQGRGAGEDH